VVIGILFHISSTIIFESSEGTQHRQSFHDHPDRAGVLLYFYALPKVGRAISLQSFF
jgi:hypothetical protein